MRLKKIKPMWTSVITTANKYVEPQMIHGTSIIDASKTKSGLKEYQTVIAVGDTVRNIKAGDVVLVNPARYEVRKYGKDSTQEAMTETYNEVVNYNFNMVNLDGVDCLHLQDRDIDFIIEEYED